MSTIARRAVTTPLHPVRRFETRDSRRLFDANAATYDRVNSIVSLGLDALWRDWVAHKAVTRPGVSVLDAFGGTGLTGIRAAELGARTTIADLSIGMLDVAQERAASRSVTVQPVIADLTAEGLPLPPAHFDALTMVFGVRYIDRPSHVLRQLSTLLKSGGRLVVLEFTMPAQPVSFMDAVVIRLAATYFFHVLPLVSSALAQRSDLYHRLTQTTRRMGGPDRLRRIVHDAGLEIVETRVMGFGLVSGVVAVKPACA